MADQQQVLELHREHPDWAAPQIAAQLGCSAGYVRATAHRAGIKLPAGQPDGLLALGWAAREAGLTVEQIRQLGRETR